MSVSLDPRKAHKALVFGDILMILTWINDERGMVLMPAHRAQGSPWFIILESAAYKYDDVGYLARQGAKAAAVIGMDESLSTARRICDLIHNYLPDLIRMPSAPPVEFSKAALGVLQVKEGGKVIAEEEIRDELQGLTYA